MPNLTAIENTVFFVQLYGLRAFSGHILVALGGNGIFVLWLHFNFNRAIT
jgi:hypothetical protein